MRKQTGGLRAGASGLVNESVVVPNLGGKLEGFVRGLRREREICYQGEMIGCDQRAVCLVKGQVVETESWVKVHVIQMKERQNAWVGARATHVISQIGTDEVLAEQTSGESTRPFIEVAEHDARPAQRRLM